MKIKIYKVAEPDSSHMGEWRVIHQGCFITHLETFAAAIRCKDAHLRSHPKPRKRPYQDDRCESCENGELIHKRWHDKRRAARDWLNTPGFSEHNPGPIMESWPGPVKPHRIHLSAVAGDDSWIV